MPYLKRSLMMLALMAAWMAPTMSFAASCDCFCGSDESGAVRIDGKVATTSACESTCEGNGMQAVGCYTDQRLWPTESDLCWSEEECETWSGQRDGKPVGAEWGGQRYDCEDGYGYCYSESHKISLNVSVGSLTEVGDIGTYIVTFYTYIIPFAAVIAVVMMMIGGLQYAMARGKAKYIDKAKTRIGNAITGLVLLLSAYVILTLIDPRLTSFDTLRLPLQKEVVLLDRDSSCEALERVGYKIDASGQRLCTFSGTISSTDNVEANVNSNLKVGDECQFSTCTEKGTACTASGCVSCVSVEDATASMCESLEAQDEDPGRVWGMKYDCFYVDSVDTGIVTDHPGVCWELISQGEEHGINCDRLRADAESSGYGCSQYNLDVTVDGEYDFGEGFAHEAAYAAKESMCVNDICGLADKVSGGVGCYWNTSSYESGLCYTLTESQDVSADAVCYTDENGEEVCE